MTARYSRVHDPDSSTPKSPDNSAVERLIADIMVAVLSLEYGTVTVTVKGGQVVGLERSERRRLVSPARPPHKLYATTSHPKETL